MNLYSYCSSGPGDCVDTWGLVGQLCGSLTVEDTDKLGISISKKGICPLFAARIAKKKVRELIKHLSSYDSCPEGEECAGGFEGLTRITIPDATIGTTFYWFPGGRHSSRCLLGWFRCQVTAHVSGTVTAHTHAFGRCMAKAGH